MRTLATSLFVLTCFLISSDLHSQFINNNRFGRQRSAIPQTQTPPPEPEKLTAEQRVDQEMPKLIEVMGLDPFEQAIVRSVLVKSVQKRMELQILDLEQKKMMEEYGKIVKEQDEELKAGLPEEKFQIYMDMRENPSKTKRKQKKKKRQSKS